MHLRLYSDGATETFESPLTVAPHLGVDTGTWALHNDNAIVDYTYRAYHLTVQAAKSIVTAYYGREGGWSYYLSCSTGGRQGVREAQQYPEDFDGVVSRVEREREHAHTKHSETKLGLGLSPGPGLSLRLGPNRYDTGYAHHSTRQVVGAPANYMAALQAFGIHVGQELLPNTSSRYISEATWAAIHDEVLRQCDTIDGVRDGVLTDPRDCQ